MLRKYGVLIVVGVLLAGSICLKVSESREKPAQQATEQAPVTEQAEARESVQEDYFAEFRAERESVREREMQHLDEVIATAGVGAETLDEAVEQKLALVENMESEFTIERLISAKGFANAAVTFHKGAVNVVVDAETLSDAQVAQILDIVQRETGVNAGDVRVTTGG